VGFNDDKQAILEMLIQGFYLHETRAFQADKNWLSTGDITQESAWAIVSKVTGRTAESSPHHADPEIKVWVFKPECEGQRWYIKCYLDEGALTFISFHPTGGTQ
jgi:hypothetical protein